MKRIRLLLIGLLCVVASSAFAQLTINAVDPGPYTPGSTLAATFTIDPSTACIAQTNVFQLYLSDASGDFTAETLIGTYSSFYSTFVNGVLPSPLAAGTGYRVRIKASSNAALVSAPSAPFEVRAGTPVAAKLISNKILDSSKDAFGFCSAQSGSAADVLLSNQSTAGTTTISLTHELNHTTTTIPVTTQTTFNADRTHYTAVTRVITADGNVATRAYFIINNEVITAFSTTGNNTVCLPGGALTYLINASSVNGIGRNFPGNTYRINWGDGTESVYTYCDLKGGTVQHYYSQSSCGQSFNSGSTTIYNAFGINIQVVSPFANCGNIGTPISTTAKVITITQNFISGPILGCTNNNVTFSNTSILGQDPNTNSPGCADYNSLFNWYVDGILVEASVPKSTNLNYIFTTNGQHVVTLESISNGNCTAPIASRTICIQNPPQPSFTLTPTTICVGTTLKPVNTSVVDESCNNNTVYSWTVSPATGVTYVNSTSSSSKNPEINFANPGTYTITLRINTATCTAVTSAVQTVTVNEAPTAVLSADAQLCGLKTFTFDNTVGSTTRTILTGTMTPEPIGTYTWTVTSGNSGTWAFVNGTNANTKYPQIRFDNFDTYTVTVTHTNNCGTVSASQKLTFNTAPVVNAGPDQAICYNDASFILAGSVTGTTSSQTWTTTGTGTFSPNANALNATYTPSVADKNAGTVTLTLTATTTLPAPCNLVSDQVVLTIKPRTFVNSLPSKTICTGTAVAYSPSSNIAGATFSWTATGGPGAGGFSASGNGATINDVLTNSNPTTNATVTYTITPNANGCAGDPFTFTVTVTPNPVLTATPVNANICSQQNAVINLSANLANTKYTWTSTAQAGVTGNTNNATPSTATSITNTLVNSTLVPKTVDYIITPISANNCPGTPVTVTITVEPQPSTPNAGADASICNTGSFVLQGNQPAVGNGKWTLVSGQSGVSFVDDTQYNTPVNGLAAGQVYVFRWTISSAASCAPKSDDVSITVNPASVGGTVAGSTAVCSGTNGGTLTLSGQTGNVIRWESSINGGTTWVAIANTTTTLNYTNLNTTTQYRAIVQSGVCAPDPAVAATITVSPAVVAANAGADQELCNQTSATLTANSPLPNTGLWTQAGGPAGATFVDATSATTQVNGLIPGQIYVFTWTISGQAPCPPSTDEVQIKINLPSDGGTTAGSASVCSGSSSGQITLSGQLGNVVRWEISTNGGTTWQTVNNTTTAINYSNLTTTTQYRAVVKNGTCAEANSAISTITVNPAVATANAGTSQELCNQTTTTLAGNSPLPNTGLWTQKSGPAGAVFADATLPNTQVIGLIPGQTYVFTWTISGQAPCPPSSSDVQVQVNLPSDGGVTTGSTSVCSGSGSGQITVSGQVGSVVRWESSTDGGATWQIINSTATSINYSNLTATTQYRAVVRNGNCATANSTISTITVNPGSISANAGPDQELCNQTSTTLAGNSPQTQTGLWTQVSGSAVTFADASLYNTQVSGLIPGQTYVFRWTINGLAPCPPSMDDMQVKVNLPSDGGATAGSTAVCSGSGNGSITLSGQVGTIQGWEQSTDGGTTWAPINNTTGSVAYSNLTITTQYRAIVKNGNCAPAYSTVAIITVNPGSISANAGPNQELCNQTSTTLAGNSPQTQSGLWTQTGGPAGASFADANLYNTQVSGLIPGNTYTFTWTISGLAPCPPSSASVTIKVNLPSDGGVTAGSTAVCSGNGNGSITLSGQVGTIQGWEQSTDGGTTWAPITNTTGSVAYSNLTVTTQYRAIVKNGNCAPAYSTVATITVNQAVAQANAGPDQTLCNSSSITLQGNSPLTNTGQWTLTSGQAGVTFADASQYNTQVNGLVGGQTYTFRWTISGSAPCPPTNDEVVITNLAPLTNTNITTPFSTACNGQVITLAGNVPSGGNGTYTYVWESSNDGGATWTTINGQTSPSLTITVNASLSYRRTVNSGNCSAISNVLQLTALPAIANNSISADHAICVGTNATPISGSQPTGGDGNNYTYGWEQSTDNGATWTAIIGANAKDYAPGAITQTTSYRRLVSSSACAGALQHISNVVKVTVNPNAKAEFSFTRDLDCFPFAINASNVKATAYPDRNATYTWYADNVVIGTGINFPGYTIATENTAVVIKLVATSSLGCSQDEMSHTFRTRPNILATFTPSAVNGCGPLDVDFTNTSNALTGVTFEWRVNNVIAGTSADFRYRFDADPFGEDKEYTVTLTIIGPCGKSLSAPQKITVYGTPIATGTPDKTRGCSPFTVNFRNTSPGSTNTYTYEIDGVIVNGPSTSKTDFPYTFTTDVVRTYKVKVTATNACGTDTREYVIVVSPNTIKPGFTVDGNKLRGCAPFDVDFTNSTVGASQYVYNFEPGQSAEISVNNRPEIKHHRFDKPGTYVVTMLATNDCSTAPVQTVTITVDPQPVAAFSANLTIGCDGLAVKFTNTSKDAIGYVWDFGDGSPTSTEVAPTHVYKGSARNYTVKLTAINSLGCPTTEEKVDYIRIVGPPKADFSISPAAVISIPNYTFKFTNESSNGAQTYKWTFGDGDASTLKDPAHTYLDTGRFLVTLRTYNEQGCVDSIQKYVHIMGIPGYVYVPNSFMPGGTNVPLQKFIAVGAGIKSWKMSVFNKWGQVLWETTKLEDGKPVEGWDGTYNNVAQPQGIYFWKIEVQLINGTEWKGVTYDKSAPKRTGEIYLIR